MRNRYIEGLKHQLPHPFRADAERLLKSFDADTVKIEGIVRWKANGRVPPTDILDFWRHVGKSFDYEGSITTAKRETKESVARYATNQRYSEEMLTEMRNEFGKGAVVVHVASGRTIKL